MRAVVLLMGGMMVLSACARDVVTGKSLTICDADLDVAAIAQRIQSAEPVRLTLPVEQELAMLQELAAFELGRSLLKNKALSGYWTAYLIVYGPQLDAEKLSPLERWVIHDCPVVKATRERFYIFRQIIQQHVAAGKVLASVPCGVMEDLLGLDLKDAKDIKLVGLDVDKASIRLAQTEAIKRNISQNVAFKQCDAWNMGVKEEYDLLTSNGLNIYEPNDERVVELYCQFFKALKPGGTLVTSFLTPPPALSSQSTWKVENPEALKKQKALFADIIQAGWQTFRTEQQTRMQLEAAGFTDVKFEYDSQGMFPTVVAKKPNSTVGKESASR